MVIILPLTTISKNPTSYLPCLTLERSHYLLPHRANEAVDMAFSLSPWVPAVCQGLLGTGERHTEQAVTQSAEWPSSVAWRNIKHALREGRRTLVICSMTQGNDFIPHHIPDHSCLVSKMRLVVCLLPGVDVKEVL